MKDRREFFTNLLLSIILPLIVSSGGATALVVFRESLPPILFHILLWVLCIFIIVVIVRLAFGDLINQLRMWIKNQQYKRSRYKLAKDWSILFGELSELVSQVSDQDWKPTKDQSIKYYKLRAWFRRNRSELLPRWYSFVSNRTNTAYSLDNSSLEHRILDMHWTDPFSCFYDPLDLERMGILLRNEFQTNEGNRVRYVIIRLRELTDEFVTYIRARER